ncbi:uncharacterized protein RHTO_08123 [Rhodotorula toruloides NP11]|uniref:Uncharacterized protein n=1 Tax=Rhodotorula toruloides (strain NP11) TaxID=1130832 RepID=M7WY62_RHOT1|nr:uncharacterized protein RHTO_08123 [Rhodotorula toruloides NP11]EMS22770.1 hypothetical protein RHTO_08123 [Rhodotorula toruloides NP11]
MSTPGGTFSSPSTPSRRYTPAAASAGYTSAASKRRRGRLLLLLGLLALVILLTVIIVPPSVVLTRKNKNNVAEGQQVVTTVVDGKTETRTLDGVVATRTRLTTLANGQASTVTSFVALPDITVSATSIDQIQTGEPSCPLPSPLLSFRYSTQSLRSAAFVTTTLTDGLVVVARTATNLQTDVATPRYCYGTRSDTDLCLSFYYNFGSANEYKPKPDFGIEQLERELIPVDSSAFLLPLNHLLACIYHNPEQFFFQLRLVCVFIGSLDIRFTLEHPSANPFKHDELVFLCLGIGIERLVFFDVNYRTARLVYNHDSPDNFSYLDGFCKLFGKQYESSSSYSTGTRPTTSPGSSSSSSASTSRSSNTTPSPTSTPGASTSSSSATRSTSSRASSSIPGSSTGGSSTSTTSGVFHPDSLCFDDGSEHAVALHHSDWLDHPSSVLRPNQHFLRFSHKLTSRHVHVLEPTARMRARLHDKHEHKRRSEFDAVRVFDDGDDERDDSVYRPFPFIYHNSASHDEPLPLVADNESTPYDTPKQQQQWHALSDI